MRILTVIGARPQFVKAAVVSRALARHEHIEEVLVHTGQHYDANMSRVFFDELGISPPAHNLGIAGGSHGSQTAGMLTGIERLIVSEKPDTMLVYGDTNSTLAGALCAAKASVPLAHVEAGLRSFNRCMPEEVNRVVTDHVSDVLFAPTATAVANLRKEGIAEHAIVQTGDVMYDIALEMQERAIHESTIRTRLELESSRYILATVHRAENTDNAVHLRNILVALNTLASDIRVVVPLHPRTSAVIRKDEMLSGFRWHANIMFIEPVGYIDMLALEHHAAVIVTDSGGVQKEAFFNKVPCVTVRSETEWVELIDSGWNTLAPPASAEAIEAAIYRSLNSVKPSEIKLYGDGRAAAQIAETLAAR